MEGARRSKLDIPRNEVENALKKLIAGKAAGLDGVATECLKLEEARVASGGLDCLMCARVLEESQCTGVEGGTHCVAIQGNRPVIRVKEKVWQGSDSPRGGIYIDVKKASDRVEK